LAYMKLDVSPEGARRRLERAGAEIEEREEGWWARLGGVVAKEEDDGIEIEGNVDRLESLLKNKDSREVTIEFDGASRGNPGPSSVAFVISDEDGILRREASPIGEGTNNEAEYIALLRGLKEVQELGFGRVEAVGDSELVVNHVSGEWKCRAKNLKPLYEEIIEIAEDLEEFEIRHVPRGANTEADELANAALDTR